MANRISRTGITGSSPKNREVVEFTFDSTLSDTWTFDSEYAERNQRQWTPGKVVMVMNPTNHVVTIDGREYARGVWDFSELGGMPITSTAIDSNNVITVTADDSDAFCVVDFRT